MKRSNQWGAISIAVIVAVTMSMLFIGAVIFGVITYSGEQDYKNNTNQKIDTAIEVTKKQEDTTKDNQFAEDSKKPTKNYQSSATFGSVSFDYPRTYSGYVVETNTDSSKPVDGYFHPNIVPSITDDSVSYALRINVVSTTYDSILKTYAQNIKIGTVKAAPFRAAKVPQTLGTRLDGQIFVKKSGTMIVLPLRDKTIEIWTESSQNAGDFSKFVIPSINFVP